MHTADLLLSTGHWSDQ